MVERILVVIKGVSGKYHDPAGSELLAQLSMRVTSYSFGIFGLHLIY